jgi:lipopolysaccharide/colanic/teichoic acid biosynthesis glycosyltransferase
LTIAPPRELANLKFASPEAMAFDRRFRCHHTFYQVAKRVLDVSLALVALVALAPLLLIIATAIALQDGFPVVFKQKRVGKGGRTFYIYKFRTMVKNAEEILRSRPDLMEEYRRTYKIQNDPRISKLGRFLRRTSLDELPQLVNVLKGEMSLVGPRPIVESEMEKYGDSRHLYLALKPGCAGLWQCSGRSETTYDERVALDEEYFMRSSIRYDLGLLCRTAYAIMVRRGAV